MCKGHHCASAMTIYSQPTGFSKVSRQDNTFGAGISNSDLKDTSVTTSLAVAKRRGTTRSGILTIIRCLPTTARKTLSIFKLLKPNSRGTVCWTCCLDDDMFEGVQVEFLGVL